MTEPATPARFPKHPGANKLPGGTRRAFHFGLAIVVLSLLSGLATGLILTGLTPIVPTSDVVMTALVVNVVFVVAMVVVIARQIIALWGARRRQAAGSRLHAKIVGLFSIIAVMPAIVLAIFASITLDRGLDRWFSDRTKTIIVNSMGVAEAYLQEHGQVLRTDAEAMARDLAAAESMQELRELRLSQQAGLRDIPIAYLINENRKPVATAAQTMGMPFLPPPPGVIADARKGQIVGIAPGRSNRVAAVKKLENFPDVYLYVARPVDPRVTGHVRQTQAAVSSYRKLEERRSGVQVAFGLMYLMIAVTMLLAAVWIGLWFANGLVAPIGRLMGAAQQISEGDLTSQVPIRRGEGDLGALAVTFNRMTSQLRIQRDELVKTNEQLTERRRFIETVLSGVSAGVMGLDKQGRITLVNPSAEKLLGMPRDELFGRELDQAVPAFADLLDDMQNQQRNVMDLAPVNIVVAGTEHKLAVQVTRELAGDDEHGFVVTFDDVTELVAAQRTAAWADVARRIAHEIKNPLTPIQLSAERLRRKYSKVIPDDREVFDRCTETIIRQVSDIGRMVDEFSAFARMPDPEMQQHDLRETVREVVFLFQSSHPEIAFKADLPDETVVVTCDRRLINQAVTNLVKNAIEAIAPVRDDPEAPDGYKGHVTVVVAGLADTATITVLDNGCGLPRKNRRRLVEPYMTTREKGTGIGLAIVHKVTEQHGGRLDLDDAPEEVFGRRGAAIQMTLPAGDKPDGRTVKLNGEAGQSGGQPQTGMESPGHYGASPQEQGAEDGVRYPHR